MRRLTALCLLVAASHAFAALPKPAKVDVSAMGPTPVFRWDEVEGASLYRVAVFAAPDDEGKRELMGAVWVRGLSWPYGNSKVVPKAGKLPSTRPKALEKGAQYKVMVSAANEAGLDKSDWASAEFTVAAGSAPARSTLDTAEGHAATPSMTPTPAAAYGTATPTPAPKADAKGSSGPAELEVDLAADFKETPEAGEGGLSKTAASAGPATLEGARALLQNGKAEDAEAAYRALLDKDAGNADYWEGLGDSFDARKMKVEAKEAYEKALAIDGKRERLKKWLDENVVRR